jgi:hypothetical protein
MRFLAPLFVLAPALAACSGVSTANLSNGADGSSDDGAHGGPDGHGESVDGGTTHADSGEDATGPRVYVRIRAVQTPIPEQGVSEETPVDQRVGIYGLKLLRSADDPSPVTVIDDGTPIDVPYNAGSTTLLGSAPARALPAGTYTIARVPVGYVNFTVPATANEGTASYPGNLHDIIALTTGVSLDGATRSRGWYSTSFAVDGKTVSSSTGNDSAIAQPGPTSGIGLDLSTSIAAYVFPITLVIPSDVTSDLEVVFTANTYEDFHWTAEDMPGYTAGVFEVTATSYEPITQLGANSCTVTIGPAPSPP